MNHAGSKNYPYVLGVRMCMKRIDEKDYNVAAVEEDLRGDFDVSTLWARVISMNFPG